MKASSNVTRVLRVVRAVVTTASYLLLWNPPKGWSQPALVAYLIATAVLIRTFISCYEIPSAALASESTCTFPSARITVTRPPAATAIRRARSASRLSGEGTESASMRHLPAN